MAYPKTAQSVSKKPVRVISPRVTIFRPGFTEVDEWRSALPNEALHVFSNFTGSLDAPEVMPAGGMRKSAYGGKTLFAFRSL